jgi:hypothetical protein
MSFEELVQHIKNQHPTMLQEAIEELAESILEESSRTERYEEEGNSK